MDLQPPLKDLGVSAFKGKHRKSGKLRLFLTMIEMGLVPPQSFFLVENCDRLSREEPLVALETFTAIINAGINVVTTDDQQLWNRTIAMALSAVIDRVEFAGDKGASGYTVWMAGYEPERAFLFKESGEVIPFDLRHHRYLSYLRNGEGLAALRDQLASRLKTLVPNTTGFSF